MWIFNFRTLWVDNLFASVHLCQCTAPSKLIQVTAAASNTQSNENAGSTSGQFSTCSRAVTTRINRNNTPQRLNLSKGKSQIQYDSTIAHRDSSLMLYMYVFNIVQYVLPKLTDTWTNRDLVRSWISIDEIRCPRSPCSWPPTTAERGPCRTAGNDDQLLWSMKWCLSSWWNRVSQKC